MAVSMILPSRFNRASLYSIGGQAFACGLPFIVLACLGRTFRHAVSQRGGPSLIV